MSALDECIEWVKEDEWIDAQELTDKAAAELLALRERVAKLEKVEECAKKLVALRGVAHGAWVIEELEAALKGI